MTMVTSIAAPAFADVYGIALYGTHYLDQGNITVEVRGGQYYVNDVLDDDGPVIIKNHEDESDTTSVSNTITIHAEDGEANVTLKDVDIVTNGEANKSGITVKADKTKTATATVNVTLDNVTVDAREDASSEGATGGAGMTIQGNGVVNIELDGKNELLAGDGHAGLEKNRTESVGSLNINDSNEDGGSLTAIGGDGGAGIGGGDGAGAHMVGLNAGVPGVNDAYEPTVTAVGSEGAAGIGGGKGGRLTDAVLSSGTLTGTMETLEYLQAHGAQTIVFTTSQRTSSFQISDLLALADEGDVFYLTHTEANEPTLLVVTSDHTDLLEG